MGVMKGKYFIDYGLYGTLEMLVNRIPILIKIFLVK